MRDEPVKPEYDGLAAGLVLLVAALFGVLYAPLDAYETSAVLACGIAGGILVGHYLTCRQTFRRHMAVWESYEPS